MIFRPHAVPAKAALLALALAVQPAAAQNTPAPARPAPATPAPPAAPATPASPPAVTPPAAAPRETGLFLGATLGPNGAPIRSGLVWRIYSDPLEGEPLLLHTAETANPVFRLEPGPTSSTPPTASQGRRGASSWVRQPPARRS